ncbi:MAG: hypothetical protein J2P58_07710, partial [Acidimicrobiaceae bacterium]|nr:hypothetical protein [Acidimicrobiaceae bacterium]
GVGVLLLAIGFIGAVFALVYGGATLLVHAWTNRFRPRIPAEQFGPALSGSVVDEAEAWLRSNPPGPDPTTYPAN